MKNKNRREFLSLLGKVGVSGLAAPLSINLATMGKVAAANNVNDYKALVCIFLYGGNDQNNTIIPVDNFNYNQYKTIRSKVAINQADLMNTKLNPINSLPSNTLELALHPSLTGLKTLFEQKKLATLFNVGPLVVPTSLEEYKKKTATLPDNLFSHNDQQSIWQSSEPEGATKGWGGTVSDILMDNNINDTFTSVSVRGNSVFLAGDKARQYQLGTSGSIPIYGARETDSIHGSKTCSDAFRALITSPSTNPVENEYTNIINRSISAETIVNSSINNIPENLSNAIDNRLSSNTYLSKQLKIVAKMIAAREAIGVKRQVFMVGIGGFDYHDNLIDKHKQNCQELNDAMHGFYLATQDLGIENSVTSFTASEFGRTFNSNGNGSDHGWGSHHFIMGGAVDGGKTYGNVPEYALNTNVDIGRGRLLPTTSLSSYITTLAKWFGISDSELNLISPNIANFNERDLGFMVR